MTRHAHGRDIIEQVLENMRGQTETLRYSAIVASSYNVHLHPDDHARLEGLIPEIVSQAKRALDEELARLNRARPLEEKLRRLVGQPRLPFQRAASEWAIAILSDPNEELDPGDILVDATLVTPGSDELAGSRTQRIVTHRHGERVERRASPEVAVEAPAAAMPAGPAASAPVPAAAAPTTATHAAPDPAASATARSEAAPALATLRWRDAAGEHAHRMTTPVIKVGRGGATYWVDVRLDTVPDVSREHFRVRWDPEAVGFLIQDLSSFGTTVDGKPLPPRPADGEAPEMPLPPRATIGLAGAITIEFLAEPAYGR
jgi:hypothetical protein